MRPSSRGGPSGGVVVIGFPSGLIVDPRKPGSARPRSSGFRVWQVPQNARSRRRARAWTMRLPPPWLSMVQGEHGGAGRLGALDHGQRRAPVGVAVELEPDGPAAGRHDVLDGLAGRVRERHDVAAGVDRAGHLDLAARMEGAERAAGAEEDRGVGAVAEERHRHVDAADVDQAPDTELVLREPLPVRAVRPLVLGAAEEGHVPVVQLRLGAASKSKTVSASSGDAISSAAGPPSRNGSWPSAWRIVGESATYGRAGLAASIRRNWRRSVCGGIGSAMVTLLRGACPAGPGRRSRRSSSAPAEYPGG